MEFVNKNICKRGINNRVEKWTKLWRQYQGPQLCLRICNYTHDWWYGKHLPNERRWRLLSYECVVIIWVVCLWFKIYIVWYHLCHYQWNTILTNVGSTFGFIFGTQFWYPFLNSLLDLYVLWLYLEDSIFGFIFSTHFRYPFLGSFLVPIFDTIYSWILQFISNFLFVIDSYFRKIFFLEI